MREVPKPLQQHVPSGAETAVQNTTFSVDAQGRYLCSTWDEAVNNGDGPLWRVLFRAFVIGAGVYGAYCAAQIRITSFG